jgi:5-methylthioadenosine/S-adenosylhomocysteine deaminase
VKTHGAVDRSLLITGGHVVTMDSERREFEGGYVLIGDNTILEVGPRDSTPKVGSKTEVINARGCVVTPGLINTHQHDWYNLFKGLGDGMLLETWIFDLLVPVSKGLTTAALKAGSKLACLEMLRTGTTTCLNHQVIDTDGAIAEAVLTPVLESGMRQVYAKELRAHDLDRQIELASEVHARWNGTGDGRIRVGLAIESTAHWVALGASSEDLVLRGYELARKLNVHLTDHVASGSMSRDRGYLKFVIETGRTDIEYLHNLGVLDERWVLAHAIHVRDHDIELIATSGASVSHTPTSEACRAGGITPVKRMLDAGVNVALGTDGPMIDTSVDMIEQAKAVRLFQNQLHLNPTAITPEAALEMATRRAAAAIGMADELGSLDRGKLADVVVFDLANPSASVSHRPLTALVHSARGADAKWVVVNGKMVIRDGAFTGLDHADVQSVIDEARTRSLEVLRRAGLAQS